MAVRKITIPGQNVPIQIGNSINRDWYDKLKFLELLGPLSDQDYTALLAQIAAIYSPILRTVIPISGTTYSFGTSDPGAYFRFTSNSAVTVTVPTNATSPIAVDSQMDGVAAGDGKVTFAPAVGVTFNSYLSYKSLIGKLSPFSLVKVGIDEWDLVGSLAP